MTKTRIFDPKSKTAPKRLGRAIFRLLLDGDDTAWAEVFRARRRGGKIVIKANLAK